MKKLRTLLMAKHILRMNRTIDYIQFFSHQNAFSVHAVYVLYPETSTDIIVYFSLNVLKSNINCRVSVQSHSDPWYLKKMVARPLCAGVMERRSFKNDKFANN